MGDLGWRGLAGKDFIAAQAAFLADLNGIFEHEIEERVFEAMPKLLEEIINIAGTSAAKAIRRAASEAGDA